MVSKGPWRQHSANAAFGILDYAAYPIGMLIVAPVVLRNLGVAQFGVWMVATAAVSTGSIIASGFGDANIQHVATGRGAGNEPALLRAVRSTMGIHLVLGSAIAAIAWAAAPLMAGHVTTADPELETSCVWCLRIAGFLMLIRAIESVCISTQRAFERYGHAVRISVLARVLSLAIAAALSAGTHSVVAIMAATAGLTALGACAQVVELKRLLRAQSPTPSFDSEATRALLRFGVFSWLLAVCGVVFSQVDRLIGGATLGAAAVVAYALCAQLAQPIYGVAAAGLHFLFPYLAGRRVSASAATLQRAVLVGFGANLALVLVGTLVLLLRGDAILRAWVGRKIATDGAALLPPIVLSSAALGMNVTGSYAMLALRRVQAVTWLNVAGGAAMLLVIAGLLPHFGISAIAAARLLYGVITLLIYIPLSRVLRTGSTTQIPKQARNKRRFFDSPSSAIADSGSLRIAAIHEGPSQPALREGVIPIVQEDDAEFVTSKLLGPRANILGVRVEALNMEQTLARIRRSLTDGAKGYICMAGVHGIMEAQRNPEVGAAFAESTMTLPDGRPTVWVGRWQGHQRMQQVTGPNLMLEVFRRREFAEYSHFLYGGKEGIAQELAERMRQEFPWVRISGTYTPPFRDLTAVEVRELKERIRRLKPDMIWVGISTPKQEMFMRSCLPMLETTLMFGVGAAFDFHTGRIKDCSDWVKRAGLQWLHRLIQDPRHLWWRYLRNNPTFLWKIALQISGLKMYPPPETRSTVGMESQLVGEAVSRE